jgi:hypothetical protein
MTTANLEIAVIVAVAKEDVASAASRMVTLLTTTSVHQSGDPFVPYDQPIEASISQPASMGQVNFLQQSVMTLSPGTPSGTAPFRVFVGLSSAPAGQRADDLARAWLDGPTAAVWRDSVASFAIVSLTVPGSLISTIAAA